MNKDELIPFTEGDDSETDWMIRYDPNSDGIENRAEWEHKLEETRRLAQEAEAATISQMRVGNRLIRTIWLLLGRQDEDTNSNQAPRVKTNPGRPRLEDIENALASFFDVHALAQNPLAYALNLSRHQRGNEPTALANGYALQRALNEALDHFTGAAPRTVHDKGLRLQHYLHFHYRDEVGHNELAAALNYHPRYLRSLRDEQIHKFAEVLVALNRLAR